MLENSPLVTIHLQTASSRPRAQPPVLFPGHARMFIFNVVPACCIDKFLLCRVYSKLKQKDYSRASSVDSVSRTSYLAPWQTVLHTAQVTGRNTGSFWFGKLRERKEFKARYRWPSQGCWDEEGRSLWGLGDIFQKYGHSSLHVLSLKKNVCFEVGYCCLILFGLKTCNPPASALWVWVKKINDSHRLTWSSTAGAVLAGCEAFWAWGLAGRQGVLERDLKVASMSSSHLRSLFPHWLGCEHIIPQAQPQLPWWANFTLDASFLKSCLLHIWSQQWEK